MRGRLNQAIIHLAAIITLVYGDYSQAALNTFVEYYPCGGGSQCQPTITPLSATATDASTVNVGDNNGYARGQSNYGVLIAAAAGSWLGGNVPTLTSSGNATSSFADTITFTGGTGGVAVTATLQLNGVISAAAANTNGVALIQPSVSINHQNAQLSLYQTVGSGEVDIASDVSITWTSQNGAFTSGNNSGVYPMSPNGMLTAVFNVPYNTPVPLSVTLGVQGSNSGGASASAALTLSAPPGATITSATNANYAAASTPVTVPALPPLAFWLLFGCLEWIIIMASKVKNRQLTFRGNAQSLLMLK